MHHGVLLPLQIIEKKIRSKLSFKNAVVTSQYYIHCQIFSQTHIIDILDQILAFYEPTEGKETCSMHFIEWLTVSLAWRLPTSRYPS